MSKMTPQEKQDLNDLCKYVKIRVMGYDERQSLSKKMVLRLKGLSTNMFIANNNIEPTANYPLKTVLNTFKYCIDEIDKWTSIRTFNDEMHKFNYVLKIVESKLNDVYMKEKEEKKKEKISYIPAMNDSAAGYKRKTEETNNKTFDDLW